MTLGFRPALVHLAEQQGLSEYFMRHMLKDKNRVWRDSRKYFEAILERCMMLAVDMALQENRSPHVTHIRIVVQRILRQVCNIQFVDDLILLQKIHLIVV